MKKRYVYTILKVLLVVFILGLSINEIDITKEVVVINHKTIKNDKIIETKQEVVVAETKLEEIKEELHTTNTVNEVESNLQEQPIQTNSITGNSIKINNVLYNRLMNDDGTYFYLNHNKDGVYDSIGVPFIDFRTDFTTRKTIIYSHSTTMGNGPFQVLQNYHNNKEFYDNNKYIEIEYNGNKYTYLIFSVYISTADNEDSEGLEYFHVMNYSNEEWKERIQEYKNKSEYDTGVEVNETDKIVILQTCSMDPMYYEKYYRYNLLIMGKLV